MLLSRSVVGYSADVQIELFVGGQRIPVAQIGRGMMIFDRAIALPAAEGELVLTVDGHQQRWSIAVRDGEQPARIIHADFRQIE